MAFNVSPIEQTFGQIKIICTNACLKTQGGGSGFQNEFHHSAMTINTLNSSESSLFFMLLGSKDKKIIGHTRMLLPESTTQRNHCCSPLITDFIRLCASKSDADRE